MRTPILSLLCGAAVLAAPAPTLRTERLTSRLYLLTGTEDGNILVFVGDSALTLVDAGEDSSSGNVERAVRAISPLPVRTVITTHYHSDHLGGNGRWRRAGATIIAHESVRAEAVKDTVITEMQWHRIAANPDALPTRTFRDSLALADGDERITIVHIDSAHTGGDAVVWFHRADVIHTGDILSTPPGIDMWTGGSIDGLIHGFDWLLAVAGPHTVIVPGHGRPVTDRAFLTRYRAMLVAMRDTVYAAVGQGVPLKALQARYSTAGYGDLLGGKQIGSEIVALVYIERRRQLDRRAAPAPGR